MPAVRARNIPLACFALFLPLAGACGGCGDDNLPDGDVVDAGDVDTDARDSDAADTDSDGDAPDAPPPTPRSVVQPSSAAGNLDGSAHRAAIRFGAPQPTGEGSGEGHRSTFGPGAARP